MDAAWFEDKAQYTDDDALPKSLARDIYPDVVRVYPDGTTQPGWGVKDYVASRAMGRFTRDTIITRFDHHGLPFGIIMRSIPVVCIDIDGKNGGIEMARTLDLPPTTAETSRSGNGFHLYYQLQDSWTANRGFQMIPDMIGLLPGVDIKGTGIVYHYQQQEWNDKPLADIPRVFNNLLTRVRDAKRITRVTRSGTSSLSPDELVMVHDKLETELRTSFMPGSRNTKLFAIGAKLFAAAHPSWHHLVFDRGIEIGLDAEELEGIIRNIQQYTD